MKPLKLVMSAFGPYANKQELDFSVLEGRNIFLVTGVTGAGKTTIFDAISYALFGEASGSSRETSSLRSHFASDDTETYVDLTFEVKGEVYQIIRSPEQEVKKKRGEGTTIKAAAVELLLPKDEKPLTRASDVQERIREIVGVDKDQFRQIVMLPQGEFRKLLESKSSDREVIFRKIFGTQAFQRVQLKLRDRRSKLSEELRLGRNSVGIYIKNLKAPIDHPLGMLQGQAECDTRQVTDLVHTLQEDDAKCIKEESGVLETLRVQYGTAKNQLMLAKENNKKLEERDQALEKLEGHLKQQEQISQNKAQLLLGKKALEVKGVAQERQTAEKKLAEREDALKKATLKEQESQRQLTQITEQVDLAKGREPQRQAMRDEMTSLLPFREKLKTYGEQQTVLQKTQEQLSQKKIQRSQSEEQIKQIKSQLEVMTHSITQGIKAEGLWNKKQGLLSEQEKTRVELGQLYRSYQAYGKKEEEYHLKKQECEVLEKDFKQKRAYFQEMEDLFRKGQAGLLAQSLQEGMPCPVCGATHHPHKPEMINGVPSEEELKRLQEDKEKSEALYQGVLKVLGELQSAMIMLLENTIAVQEESLESVLGENYKAINERSQKEVYIVGCGRKLKESIDTLEAQCKEHDQEMKLGQQAMEFKSAIDTQLQTQEKLVGQLVEEITHLTGELATTQQMLHQIEADLPAQLRDANKLEERIRTLQNELDRESAAYEQLLGEEKRMRSAYGADAKDKENKTEEYQVAGEEVAQKQEALKRALWEQGFENYEHYQAAYMDKEAMVAYEEQIRNYEQELGTLRALYAKAVESAQDIQKVEIVTLEQTVVAYEQQINGLVERIAHIKGRIAHNQEQLGYITATSQKIADKEQQYGIVAELENVAFGDTANKKRMTFESYVLTAYFDEIIFAANRRLEKMSAGRFELRRKEDLAKGRGKQGLELEVLDYHTGRARDVKTLSGGEGFKASLALALGLADVIQSHAGGISIETMFVDEGFGTLDAASLDSAIECLLGLQQGGRLIGIISHVAELSERIEVALEVKPDEARGSKAEFVI